MRTFLSIFFIFLVNIVFSQSIVLLNSGVEVDGDTVEIVCNDLSLTYTQHLEVKNNTDASHDVKVQLSVLSLVSGAEYALCWDNCYSSPRDGFVTGAINLAAGETESSSFSFDYAPNNNAGESFFRCSFFYDNSPDTSKVVLHFTAGATAIEPTRADFFSIVNPVADFIILPENIKSGHIVDMSGRTVKKFSNNCISVTYLKSGVYLLYAKLTDGTFAKIKFLKK